MDNLIDTIESQYSNSPRIMALINSFNESVDPAPLFDDFYRNVWDVNTAKGWGLDLWGRIVVIDRVVKLAIDKDYFRWAETGDFSTPWGVLPWYRYTEDDTESYYLEDNAFRLLVMVKAMANISDGTIATYNKMLMSLFPGRGNAYVSDNHDMSITLNFRYPLYPYEKEILATTGVFPAPCGQKVLIEDIPYNLALPDSELAPIDSILAKGD